MQISTQNLTTPSIQLSIDKKQSTSARKESNSEAAVNWMADIRTEFAERSEQASERYSKLFREYILTAEDQFKIDTHTTLIRAYGVTTSDALDQYRDVSADKGMLVDSHY